MAILFVGSEDIDFSYTGQPDVVTSSSQWRNDVTRTAIGLIGSASMLARFSPSSVFWIGMMAFKIGQTTSNATFLTLYDGSTPRASIKGEDDGRVSLWVNAGDGTPSKVATSTQATFTASLIKYDVRIDYAGGRLTAYAGHEMVLDYSGRLSVDGSTTLSAVSIGNPGSGSLSVSEVIVATSCTRMASLYTLVPNAILTQGSFSGDVAAVAEIALNDATVVQSSTDGDEMVFGLTAIPANAAVQGVVVNARAKADVNGTDTFVVGVNSSYGTPVGMTTDFATIRAIAETNPSNNSTWTSASVNSATLGVKLTTTQTGNS